MYFVWFVVAGPDRPVPEKPKPRAAQEGYAEWEAGSSKAGSTATSTANAKNGLYDRLHAAVAERGWVACSYFRCACNRDTVVIAGKCLETWKPVSTPWSREARICSLKRSFWQRSKPQRAGCRSSRCVEGIWQEGRGRWLRPRHADSKNVKDTKLTF